MVAIIVRTDMCFSAVGGCIAMVMLAHGDAIDIYVAAFATGTSTTALGEAIGRGDHCPATKCVCACRCKFVVTIFMRTNPSVSAVNRFVAVIVLAQGDSHICVNIAAVLAGARANACVKTS